MPTKTDKIPPTKAGRTLKKRRAKTSPVPVGKRRIILEIPVNQHKEFEIQRGNKPKTSFYSQIFQNSIKIADEHIAQKEAVVEKEVVEKIVEIEVFRIPTWVKFVGGGLLALVLFLFFRKRSIE